MPHPSRLPVLAWAFLLASCSRLPAQEATLSATPDASTAPASPLASAVGALLQAPAAQAAHWGIAVYGLDGRPVYLLHPEQFFRPASTAKLFTTAAAMSLLGPSARAVSTLRFPSPGADGTVKGDLVLQGGDDADLSGQEQPWAAPSVASATPKEAVAAPLSPLHAVEEFAADVAAQGVRSVTGDVTAPNTWDPYPQGWAFEDILWGYGAPVSATGLHNNQLDLRITGGAIPGVPATVILSPEIGYYRVAGTISTTGTTATGVTLHHDPGDGTLRLQGSLGVGEVYKTEIAIDDPALFAAQALRRALLAQGIAVSGVARAPRTELPDTSFLHRAHQPLALPATPFVDASSAAEEGTVVLTHHAPTLSQDATFTLKESQNLHAELLLRRLGGIVGENTTVGGAQVVHQWLLNAGVPEHGFVLFDGSGLSTKDLVTPYAETALLLYATRQPWFAQWKAALPVGGVDGTLASRFTMAPLKGNVFAKTGTLGESRALAGFLRCASGKEVAFSIMVDNHEPGTPVDRRIMDNIVAVIAAAN